MLEILEKYTKMADLTKKGMILFFNLCFNLEETEKVKGVLKKKVKCLQNEAELAAGVVVGEKIRRQ